MKLKSLNDVLLEDEIKEMSIAKEGDWEEGVKELGNYSDSMIYKWNLLDVISIPKLGKDFEFRQLRNSLIFILGYWIIENVNTKLGIEQKKVFRTIFKISMTRMAKLESKLGLKRLIYIDGVAVIEEFQRNDITKIIYKYLVNELHYSILGGKEQYFGARKLWARLSKELDLQVHLVDLNTKEYIEKDVILHHGNYDSDFDKRLWDYQDSKEHIRSILVKIL